MGHWTRIAFVLVLALVPAGSTRAGGGCCDRCGCEAECCRVCRVVCEMKETKKVTYCCKEEDICVPGPSQRCVSKCDCGHCAACRQVEWQPTVAYVKTRKVPVKHEEIVLKPTYKWVVEYVCPHCADACQGGK